MNFMQILCFCSQANMASRLVCTCSFNSIKLFRHLWSFPFNRNTRELNKLSVIHFKGSARLTQFSPAGHKLYRDVSWSALRKLYHRSSQKEFSSPEQYVKGFQRFHAGEDVRRVTCCKFLLCICFIWTTGSMW